MHSATEGEALQFPLQKINAGADFPSLGGLMHVQCSKQCQNKVGAVEVLGIFIVKHFDFSPIYRTLAAGNNSVGNFMGRVQNVCERSC